MNEREQRAWDNLIGSFDNGFRMLLDVATMAAKGGNGAPMTALVMRVEELVAFYNACTAPPPTDGELN
jgi:hypothetical protein